MMNHPSYILRLFHKLQQTLGNFDLSDCFIIIHPFSILSIRRSGRGGAGAYPSGHRAKGGVHP